MRKCSLIMMIAVVFSLLCPAIDIWNAPVYAVSSQSDGYWQLVDTETVIPADQIIGDKSDTRETKFKYAEGSVTVLYNRTTYDGIHRTYLNEVLTRTGGWSPPPKIVAPEEKVALHLSASIDQFKRLSINYSGITVKAYFAELNTPFGRLNAGAGDFVDQSGQALCEAVIADGVIKVAAKTKEVSGTFGQGRAGLKKALFIVVRSDQVIGVKYIYEWKTGDSPVSSPASQQPAEPEIPDTKQDVTKSIKGAIYFDQEHTKPIPNTYVHAVFYDKKGEITGDTKSVSDSQGRYVLPINQPLTEDHRLKVGIEFSYNPEGVNYLNQFDERDDKTSCYMVVTDGYIVESFQEEMVYDFCPLDGYSVNISDGWKEQFTDEEKREYKERVKENCRLYEALLKAFEIYKEELGVTLDYKLPVDVHAFRGGQIIKINEAFDSFYQSANGDIYLGFMHASYHSPLFPYAVFHEFSHFSMQCMYGHKLPMVIGDVNHGGYANTSTADSYMEGYAVFMGLILQSIANGDTTMIIPGRMNIEVNYNAWDESGKAEEFAVAGTLWDLIDDPSNDDDEVAIDADELWSVLKEYRSDFTAVYEALVKKYPNQKRQIDQVFKNHGFFFSSPEGDGVYTIGEAFIDTNKDTTYTKGERFVDYNTKDLEGNPTMQYKEGDPIGSASYASDPQRRSSEPFSGHYLRVANDLPYYIVSVKFYDYPALDYMTKTVNQQGMVYVEVPPTGYDCELTVWPEGQEESPLVFSSIDFRQNYASVLQKGYFLDNAFDENGKATEFDFIETRKTENGTETFLLVVAGIIIVVVVGGIFLLRRFSPRSS